MILHAFDFNLLFQKTTFADLPGRLGETYMDWFLSGLFWTVSLSLSAWILAFTLGSLLGIMRTSSSSILRFLGTAYVEVFRNIPLLVQLFLWVNVIPRLVFSQSTVDYLSKEYVHQIFFYAFIGLGFYTASRVCEQVRAGIEAVPKGLKSAATAGGMKGSQIYRHVLLPISYRTIIPPLTSEFLSIFKNSSVAYGISFVELMSKASGIAEDSSKIIETYTFITLTYMSLALIVTVFMHYVAKATYIPGIAVKEK